MNKEKEEDHQKRWRDEIEEDLNIMGRSNKRVMVKDLSECRRISLEVDAHNGL